MSKHRRPTLPDSFLKPQPGECRWCGKDVLDAKGNKITRKRCWHPECVKVYRIACFSSDQRAAVFERDKGVCARCGVDAIQTIIDEWARLYQKILGRPQAEYRCRRHGGRYWQADHIRPLIEAEGRPEYFELTNLQTLCHACHVAKGREDNARRRQARDPQPTLL